MWNDEGFGTVGAKIGSAGLGLAAASMAMGSVAAGMKGGFRDLIIKYASQQWAPENDDTHTSALIAFQALSVEQGNKEAMWNNQKVRSALVASAKLDVPEANKAKLSAICTLKNLTTEAAIMEQMWND